MSRTIWPAALVSTAIAEHEAKADPHAVYLRADGTRTLAGNMAVSGGITVDGRDISADGATLTSHVADPPGAHPQYQADALFGDGSDGNVLIVGTVTLTRAMFYDDLRVQAGAVLQPDGFPIYVRGTLTVEATGAIRMNGADGSGSGGGTGYPATGVLGAQSGSGGNGRNSAGAGSAGGSPPANQMHPGGAGSAGVGGSAGAQPGGAPGASVDYAPTFGEMRTLSHFGYGHLAAQGTGNFLAGGAGGGGGGCDPGVDTAISGGGGAGGGVVLIACYSLANAGKIQADGGRGADGSQTGAGVAGGGGGGSGGQVHVFAWGVSALGTVQASGGGGGNGAGGGIAGDPGAAGFVNVIQAT